MRMASLGGSINHSTWSANCHDSETLTQGRVVRQFSALRRDAALHPGGRSGAPELVGPAERQAGGGGGQLSASQSRLFSSFLDFERRIYNRYETSIELLAAKLNLKKKLT